MSLTSGRVLTHYRLVEQIGEGGMGVVWRATDTTLGRDVAIKVVPEEFSRDPERMARFEREAKILASLNHPHVASIYGLGSADGVRFLAMELVQGDDLATRLVHGPIPVVEALDMARQVAEALEAAHEKGIIHRDLKPANVKVTPDGQVKVLDFGLAKALEGDVATSSPSMTQSPTLTEQMTAANVILGTAAYMSPEQARGRAVDRRADIWAFGCLLYECLTGRRAFTGETVSDTLARILERDPDLSALPGAVPRRIRELVERCLAKDSKLRLRDIGDARIVIDEVLASRTPSGRLLAVEPAASGETPRRPALWVALTGAGGIAIGAALWALLGGRGGDQAAEARCVTLAMPEDLEVQSVRLSTDSRTMVVMGRPKALDANGGPQTARIYARRMDSYEFKLLPGTEGAGGFSMDPDGRGVMFVAPVQAGATQKRLAHVPLDGSSPPTTFTDWKDSWGSVARLRGGDILVMDGNAGFVRLSARGGSPSAAVRMDAGRPGVSFYALRGVLPGDRAVLVDVVAYDARGWHYSVGVLDPMSGRVKVVEEDGGGGSYSPTGHLLFARGADMLAVPFDGRRFEARGTPVAVWSGISTNFPFVPGLFWITGDGSLYYRPGQVGGSRKLALIDATGKVEPWSTDERGVDDAPAPSPDGERFACSIANARGIDEIWISDVARPNLRRLGTDPNADCTGPLWSPDGKRIAYRRRGGDGKNGIYMQSADGGEAQWIVGEGSPNVQNTAAAWLPDGSAMVGWRQDPDKSNLWFLPFVGGKPDTSRLRVLLPSAFNQMNPQVTRDGRLLAYSSNESGKMLNYVVELHSDGSTGRPIEIRTDGTFAHFWSADGRTLWVEDGRRRIVKVAMARTPALAASPAAPVLDFDALHVQMWSVLPDGRFFVGLKNENEGDITRFNFVLNWTKMLKRKLQATR